MNINIVYRHLESTESIEEKIREKAAKLEKYFHKDVEVNWTCGVDGKVHFSHVKLNAGHESFYAEAEADNLYKTFDIAMQSMVAQLSKKHEKAKDKHQRA